MVTYYKKYFLNVFLLKRLFINFKNQKLLGKNQIFFKKNVIIFNKMSKNSIFIYKGNKFRCLFIKYFHTGYRLGNFVFTRKPFKYIIKSKINKKSIKR